MTSLRMFAGIRWPASSTQPSGSVLTTIALMALVYGVACWAASVCCHAQENRNRYNLLLLPTSRDAQATLQQSCQLWSNQLLRPTVVQLQNLYPLHIWLDRRVDPSQTVALSQSTDNSTLGVELEKMAISCGAAGGLIENVYTIAPANRLARMQRAAVVLHGQIVSQHEKIGRDNQALAWPDITSSNELLETIQRTWGVQLVDGQLPHDLLHQGQLPRCSLATQLTLLLGGFDLQATVEQSKDSNQVRLTIQPLSPSTAWRDTYVRTFTQAQLAQLKERFPDCTVEGVAKNSTMLLGETNTHTTLLSLGLIPKDSGKKRRGDKSASRVFTFEMPTPMPVEELLKQLATQLRFELVWADDCTPNHRNRLIKLKVDSLERQEMLDQIANAADLRIVDQSGKLLISPNSNSNAK